MSMSQVFNVTGICNQLGQELLVSDWLQIDQSRIDRFAEATGDRQWIHVNPARAANETPFGSTLAHGFLLLSLMPTLGEALFNAAGLRMSLNYGLNRVRFISPVRTGSWIRARYTLAGKEDINNALQMLWRVTMDIQGECKPACVAEFITRWYPVEAQDQGEWTSPHFDNGAS
jgi:acyl dehydratase